MICKMSVKPIPKEQFQKYSNTSITTVSTWPPKGTMVKDNNSTL